MTDEQCYKILGVKLGASEQEIKDAYKFLAQSLHPDKFAATDHKIRAEEKLKELNAARDQILKSMKNSNSEQTNRPASHQPSGVRPVPPNPKSKKLRASCLIIAIGILGLLIIAFLSIYIGKNFLSPGDSNSEGKEPVTVGPKMIFSPEVKIELRRDLTTFRVRLLEMIKTHRNNVNLRVSICNIGSQTSLLSNLRLWYTPVDGGNTINWDTEAYLKPNECKVQEEESFPSTDTYDLNRPFGNLNFTMDEAVILGSMDLNEMDSRGYIQFIEAQK